MADSLCGPSNALQNLQKQTSGDRTLQQDRVIARQGPAESFRSTPGPNAGILDAEFEAFQAGQPLQAGYPEPDKVFHGPPASNFQQDYGQPQLPSWASDFQNMHLNETGASPLPQSQFRHLAPLQRTRESHQDFAHQQNQPSPYQSQQQPTPATQNYSGWPYGYTGGLMTRHHHILSPMAHQMQPERQIENSYDEAAFERAFDAARDEMQQLEENAQRNETQIDAGLHDTRGQDSQETLDRRRIGSDRILDEAQELRDKGKEGHDNEELARTAGQLLENVKGDQSQKFKNSNFLSLMRQLRDKEVRVEDDKLIDSSQPLHPGGSGYPLYHARSDHLHKEEEAHESATATNEEYKVDDTHPPDPTLALHNAPNSFETTDETDDESGEYQSLGKPIHRYMGSQQDPGPSPPDHPYTQQSVIDQLKANNHALQDYQMQLMLLESHNKKRLHMARQEQDNLGLNPAPGQSGSQQAAAGQRQE